MQVRHLDAWAAATGAVAGACTELLAAYVRGVWPKQDVDEADLVGIMRAHSSLVLPALRHLVHLASDEHQQLLPGCARAALLRAVGVPRLERVIQLALGCLAQCRESTAG